MLLLTSLWFEMVTYMYVLHNVFKYFSFRYIWKMNDDIKFHEMSLICCRNMILTVQFLITQFSNIVTINNYFYDVFQLNNNIIKIYNIYIALYI